MGSLGGGRCYNSGGPGGGLCSPWGSQCCPEGGVSVISGGSWGSLPSCGGLPALPCGISAHLLGSHSLWGGPCATPGPGPPPPTPRTPHIPVPPPPPPVDQCGDAVRPGGDHRAFGLRLAPPTFGLAPPPVQGWSRPFSDCPRPPRLAPPPIKFRFVTAPRPRAVPLRAPQAAPSLWAWLEREGATAPARVMASREWVWRLSFKGAAAAPRVEKGRGAPRPL